MPTDRVLYDPETITCHTVAGVDDLRVIEVRQGRVAVGVVDPMMSLLAMSASVGNALSWLASSYFGRKAAAT